MVLHHKPCCWRRTPVTPTVRFVIFALKLVSTQVAIRRVCPSDGKTTDRYWFGEAGILVGKRHRRTSTGVTTSGVMIMAEFSCCCAGNPFVNRGIINPVGRGDAADRHHLVCDGAGCVERGGGQRVIPGKTASQTQPEMLTLIVHANIFVGEIGR